MRVGVDADVFADPSIPDVRLIELIALVEQGRHHVVVDPVEDPRPGAWLDSLAPRTAAECRDLLDLGIEQDRSGPNRELRVVLSAESRWNDDPPRLSVPDALAFLRQPFEIWVEDGISDRDFVLAVARREWREQIKRLEGCGLLRFQNGGGLPNLLRHMQRGADWERRRLRTWILFDSDALVPARPSRDSEALRRACVRKRVGHDQLRRRACENYLPEQALEHWKTEPSNADEKHGRRQLLAAFRALPAELRYHFNMKAGLAGDRGRLVEEKRPDPYATLGEAARAALTTGFGRDIARLFRTVEFGADWLRADDPEREIPGIIERLLRAV